MPIHHSINLNRSINLLCFSLSFHNSYYFFSLWSLGCQFDCLIDFFRENSQFAMWLDWIMIVYSSDDNYFQVSFAFVNCKNCLFDIYSRIIIFNQNRSRFHFWSFVFILFFFINSYSSWNIFVLYFIASNLWIKI